MRKTHWVVVTRNGKPYSLPGPGDVMLFRTRTLALDAARDWQGHLSRSELSEIGPLSVQRLKLEVTYSGPKHQVAPMQDSCFGFDPLSFSNPIPPHNTCAGGAFG